MREIDWHWQDSERGKELAGASVNVCATTSRQAKPANLVSLKQVHGSVIRYAEETECGAEGDGLFTTIGLTIGVVTADCIPLVLLSPDPFCYAVLHAGWRGVRGGIVVKGLEMFAERGIAAGRLVTALGPGICGHCYEVGEEFKAWASPFLRPKEQAGKYLFDLPAMIMHQLQALGVSRIVPPPACTYEDENLPSHRRPTRKAEAQRILTFCCQSCCYRTSL